MISFEDTKFLPQRRLMLKALGITPVAAALRFANAASDEQEKSYG